jgi:hypothetical protein
VNSLIESNKQTNKRWRVGASGMHRPQPMPTPKVQPLHTRSACVPHGIPTGLPHSALSVLEGSLPLLPPLRLLRQSLIDHLRDTVQNPYLLHPHTLTLVDLYLDRKSARIKTLTSHRSITGGKSGYLKEIVRIRLKVSQLVSAKPARNQLRSHVT